MQSRNWKSIAEFVGIAAIVASLIFVGLQLRQEEKIAFAEYGQSTSAIWAEIDIAIADNADTWAKSNDGKQLTDAERTVMISLVNAMYRASSIERIERGRLGQDDRFVTDIFAIILFRNPGARQIWKAESAIGLQYLDQLDGPTFTHSMRDEILDSLNKLDSLNNDQ